MINVFDLFKTLHAYELIIFVRMHLELYVAHTTSSESPSPEEEELRKFQP